VYRVALISDIHANEIALRDVLAAIDRRGADEVVCLGDVATLGVEPGAVVDRLQGLGCRCIMGNHDDYILQPDLLTSGRESSMIIDAIDWCRDQLSREQIDFISGFESGFELDLGGMHRMMLYHGSPSSNIVDLLADTPADVFDEQLGPDRATVMVGGHSHIQMLRQHRGALVVNPGSVGAPFEEYPHRQAPTILDHAEYADVEVCNGDIAVTLHRVALDRRELEQAALASAIPMRRQLAAPYQ
jgi:putative phosphoesterase